MISLYSGTPGSGKSLHLASRLYWKVKRGEPIICNFPIATEKITKKKVNCFSFVDNSKLTPKYLEDYAREYWIARGGRIKEDSILLVIDEAQLIFNSRDWGRGDRKEWLAFFTLHRHLGFEILLCCQFDRMLDRQIRCLIEYEYIHRKLKNFGLKGFVLDLVLGGRNHISVKTWYPLKEKIGSEFFKCKKKYYSIYDTYRLFSEEGDVDAVAQDGGTAKGDPPSDGVDVNTLEAKKE